MYELPVKNLTSQFASAIPISCNRGITLLSEYIFEHRRVQRPRFFIKGLKLWRFDNIMREFGSIFTAHAQKRLFTSLRSKI